jgi:hypothetical protein
MRAFLFGAVIAAFGCGEAHLGDDYGKKTKAIMEAQAAGATDEQLTLDADDAIRVYMIHRGLKVESTSSQQSSSSTGLGTPSSGMSPGGGEGEGGTGSLQQNGPIRLEAK